MPQTLTLNFHIPTNIEPGEIYEFIRGQLDQNQFWDSTICEIGSKFHRAWKILSGVTKEGRSAKAKYISHADDCGICSKEEPIRRDNWTWGKDIAISR